MRPRTTEEWTDFREAARILQWFESRPDHPRAYTEVLVDRYWQLIDRLVINPVEKKDG